MPAVCEKGKGSWMLRMTFTNLPPWQSCESANSFALTQVERRHRIPLRFATRRAKRPIACSSRDFFPVQLNEL